jgi:hypothetical protein
MQARAKAHWSSDTVVTMAERKKGWRPATVGEAKEYLDTHERGGDPAMVKACEAMIDVIEHRSGPASRAAFARPRFRSLPSNNWRKREPTR